MLFSKNVRRNGKGPQGNFMFRRRRTTLRVEMKHLLELNPETDATRREKRLRTAGKGVRIAAMLLFAMALISAGKIVVQEAFLENPHFKLQHLSVTTDGILTSSQIVAATGLREEMNLLGVSLVQVREKLEALPQVKKAKVSRGYPGLLFLQVEQRQPVAWLESTDLNLALKAKGYGCLLDAEGYVIPSDGFQEEQRRLPAIQLGKLDRIVPGQKVESPSVLMALQLLKAHEKSSVGSSVRLHTIVASKAYSLTALYESNISVTFPTQDFEKQLSRLGRVFEEAGRQKWRLASVDLLVEQNVPVTLRGPTITSRNPGHRALADVN